MPGRTTVASERMPRRIRNTSGRSMKSAAYPGKDCDHAGGKDQRIAPRRFSDPHRHGKNVCREITVRWPGKNGQSRFFPPGNFSGPMFVRLKWLNCRVGGKNLGLNCCRQDYQLATSDICRTALLTTIRASINSSAAATGQRTARSRTLPFIVRLASAARAVR